MVTFTTGDMFDSEGLGLVIPVNTRGVAGAGLAKRASKVKGWMGAYKAWLKERRRYGGSTGLCILPPDEQVWVFAATKEDPRQPSTIAWVTQCLWRLKQLNVPLALPKLGCGLGGLEWEHVRRQVEAYGASAISDWTVYE